MDHSRALRQQIRRLTTELLSILYVSRAESDTLTIDDCLLAADSLRKMARHALLVADLLTERAELAVESYEHAAPVSRDGGQ